MDHPFAVTRLRSILSLVLCAAASCTSALAQCSSPANAIVAENCLAGSPSSQWDIYGSGDPTIQGFATDISFNVGQTVSFKISTDASSYTIDIYRIGYYAGNGARKVASISPSAQLPQSQPACITDASTLLLDCGNWAVSASWAIPSTATSGVYFAHIARTDTGGDSHIVFVVRNDASQSEILFQTSDETWQAYNNYGGNSLYGGPDTFNLPIRAYKASYNRPFTTRSFNNEAVTWVFGTEYPMIRWLEANGYNVTYFTGIDAARNGTLITNHQIYLSLGHDEYWSGPHRASVQAALAAGVNMAFLSGNEVFWKTRWENSIDGSNTAYRTLVCYKETLVGSNSGGIMDPDDPPTWTGTWRDPRFSPPADGGLPENSLTGNLFMVNGPAPDDAGNLSMLVPAADGQMRYWRNTAVASQAPGATYTLPPGTLGYEWNEDVDNGFRPAGTFQLSTATFTLTTDLLLDYGAVYGAGIATHHMTMYRAPSGALVFGAGSIQWSWGLDSTHDNPFFSPNSAADPNMQQATVNLFADMGVQPATLQPGLVPASKSTDTTPPASTISAPASGSTVNTGTPVTISGTATDSGGGVVAGVEVSVDGGQTWHPAPGRGSWTYSWIPTAVGTVTIESRAVDDSGNLERPASGYSLIVAPQNCPCDAWSPSNPSAVPGTVDSGDSNSIEVGAKFTSDTSGYITGIRFYKSTANTGTHVGNLWSNAGALLASATFTNETSSGWQQVTFSTPVSIAAGTIYVASYLAPAGHYSADAGYFASSGLDDPPIHLQANTVTPNGVYSYSTSNVFPTSTFNATNYWVDVVFTPSTVQILPASLSFASQLVGTSSSSQALTVSNTGTAALLLSSISLTGANGSDFAQTNNCGTSLSAGTNCTISVTFTPSGTGVRGATISISNSGPVSPQLVTVTGTGILPQPPPGTCPCSIWSQSVTPTNIDSGDGSAVEVGTKFTSSQNGFITGVRFYKSTADTGTHIGSLWTTAGVQLATVAFTNEGVSGWQQATFASPVPVAANTTYIVSYYAPVGHYSADGGYFGVAVNSPPLEGIPDNLSSNGVYGYGATSSFPQSSYNSTNYWVDVVFMPSPVSVSPTSLTFSSQLPGTSSPAQPVTLSNTGNTTVNLTSITITGTNSTNFTETNTCGSSVAAGTSCTINITYSPTVTGTSIATLTVTDNAPGSPQTVSLSGTSAGPIGSLSQTSLVFASQVVASSSAAQSIVLSNTGNAALTLTSITIAGVNSGDFAQLNNCGTSLAAGAYCIISVTFIPTALATRSATVSIVDNTPGSPETIGLTGTGVATAPPPGLCPCSLWSGTAMPATPDSGDGSATEVGVKFTATQNGFITGIRFYKSAANTGTHIGNLWTTAGTQLATVTFTNEGASGWQQMNFSSPVAIAANTTYVASYYAPVGHYSADGLAFASAGVNTPPLQALANTVSANGVFTYAATSSFPQSTFGSTNYWVDVVYMPSVVSPSLLSFNSQLLGTSSTAQVVTVSNTTSSTLNLTSIAITGTNGGDFTQTAETCGATLGAGTSCTISIAFSPTGAGPRSATLTITDNALGSPQTVTLAGSGVASLPPPGVCPCTIWGANGTPTTPDAGDSKSVEVGVKFTSDLNGYITGIRFYKSAANTGTHIGNLWTTAGVLLATATFTGESASGWQQVNFSSPVPITANTTYVASYFAPSGHYSGDGAYFATGLDNPPLHALSNSASPDGVFTYGSVSSFPQTSFNSTNYWVDVVMATTTISLAPPSLSFNQASGTTSAPQVVTVTNSGAAALSFNSITIIGANSADFAQTNTCGGTVASNGTCTISVTFTPSQTSTENAAVSLADNGVFSPQGISLTGLVVAPTITLVPTSLTFSNTLVGTPSAVQAITVSNTGTGTMNLTSIAITGTNSGDFSETTTCGATLANGSNCSISVTFKPTATGARSASVTITDTASGSPQTVGLTGTGAVPIAGLAPTSLTFVGQSIGTSSAAQAITLSNTGTVAMSITSIAITGTNSGDFSQTNTCGTSVAAGGNCSISVTFTPTATGARSASVAITDNASGSPQTAGLSGTGTAPIVTLAPTSAAFGTVSLGTTTAGTAITLSNTGTASLTITSITITGANAGDFSETNTCTASIAVGGNCIITAKFAPLAGGARSAAISVADNATGSPQTVPLSGTGALTISGTVAGNGGNAATVTLTSGSTTVATTTASSTGTYTFTNIASGSYTVTPTKSGYTFLPASQAVTVTTANLASVNFATAIAIDATVSKDATARSTTIATAAFSTTTANELLLAFVSSDWLSGTNTTVKSITGGGLTWVLVVRSNTQDGTAEIWRAFATAALTNVTVQATLSQSVYSSMTVMSFKNVNTTGTSGSGAIGATASKGAASGAPTASLVTTKNNSWVVGGGDDWDTSTARTLGTGQTMVHQDLATSVQDTYWVQRQTAPTPTLGTTVTINDTAPTKDRWNLAICEILTP